jgi:hypothetical protein
MSYNISHCETLKCDAWISSEDVEEILKHEDEWLPEMNFMQDVKPFQVAKAGKYVIKEFEWCGTCSGYFWDKLLLNIAPKIHGTIEAVVTWEGGDSVSGLRIKDGKVSQPKVVVSLAEDDD